VKSKRLIFTLVFAMVVLGAGGTSGCLLSGRDTSAASVTEPQTAPLPVGLVVDDPSPPTAPVKLIFIHHSCGANWLNDGNGGLGIALRDNNYFVSDTNYGWGPDGIGDRTDIGHWWDWFRGANSATYLGALYTEYAQHASYTRLSTDPGGENEIILFKSCYPNSYLGGNPADPPATGDNPLRGHDAYDDTVHTVGNAKGIYNDILAYFATRQDKLFIAVTAPPQAEGETDATHAANARAFNDWLVNDWLDGYPHDNVAVFDFYNVLTSNGGDPNTNDLGEETGNHHRWWGAAVQHLQTVSNDYAAYPSGDSHPTAAGNRKATAEFVPLLNVFYNRWALGDTTESRINLPFVFKTYTPTPPQPSSGNLLQPTDLVYLGAFSYPTEEAWTYSGHALAYYPAGDPDGPDDGYPGSLFAAGHVNDDLVGEMSIPAPLISDDFDDLPVASVLQPLSDMTGGWKDNCTYVPDCIYREVDGLEYLPNVDKIAWNLRDWYNVTDYDQDSLGWSDRDMSGAQGVWHIGERPSAGDVFHNAKTCGYLFTAPERFAGEYLEGKWLIAGNHREAGAFGGSQGPTLYALAPWEDADPPASGQSLDALALLYYPEIYPGCLDDPNQCYFPDYRPKDAWGGGAWVQTADRHGVLIVGRKGLGDNCYGSPEACGGDPCSPYQGYHAYPYEPQILFYDPQELAEVAAGSRQPWDVVPYAVYRPVNEMMHPACAVLGSAAYDRERGLVYITEQEGGPWGETLVHVWAVGP
jgi:hypothetical protein